MKTQADFSIQASTYFLLVNNEYKEFILQNGTKFKIPIYQEPYYYSESEIRDFIYAIFTSFWGNGRDGNSEPIFIGNIQLISKKIENCYEVIDGQKILTTFLLFIKLLQTKFPDNEELKNTKIDWLITSVNNGNEQKKLDEVLKNEIKFDKESLNYYIKNISLLNKILEEQIEIEYEEEKKYENSAKQFKIDNFIHHLFYNIYFIVIVTKECLNKALPTYNALNIKYFREKNRYDIFKIRMYEYLKYKKQKDDKVFEEINEFYKKLLNVKNNFDINLTDVLTGITGIEPILKIYQYILIPKYKLPTKLYGYCPDIFFEKLFDSIFNIKQWEHFSNAKNVELSLDELNKILNLLIEFDEKINLKSESINNLTLENICNYKFIDLPGIGIFWYMPVIFLYFLKNNGIEDYWNKMLKFTKLFSNFYIIQSIIYSDNTDYGNKISYELLNLIFNNKYDELINKLNECINDKNTRRLLIERLNSDNIDNEILEKFICPLTAMLEEDYKMKEKEKIEEINKILFAISKDIAHIQPIRDKDGNTRVEVWNEWGDKINSIGNLVLLESNKDELYYYKEFKDKKNVYKNSKLTIVKKLSKYEKWEKTDCENRKNYEINKILNYLYPEKNYNNV